MNSLSLIDAQVFGIRIPGRNCVGLETSTDYADYTDSLLEQLNAVPFSKKESV